MVLLKPRNRGTLLFVLSFATGIAVSFNNCSKIQVADMPETVVARLNAGAMVFINDDAEFTNDKNVTLRLEQKSASEMYVTNDPTCQSGGAWEPYNQFRSWSLDQENGSAKVFAKFKESEQSLESGCFDDSIIHDNVPPVLVVTTPAPALSNQSSINIQFAASDALSGISQLDCKDGDGKPLASCSENLSLSALAEGPGSVKITAQDKAGNNSVPLIQTYIIDRTPPVVLLTSTPSAVTSSLMASFSFTGTDLYTPNVLFECKVDTDAFSSCSSPFAKTLAKDGVHQFSVRGKDQAGNISAPVSYQWKIDTTVPSVQITAGPKPYENTDKSSFSFTGTDDGQPITKFDCQVDNKGYSACTSPKDYAGLLEGSHLFMVRGYDSAGNLSAPAQRSWIIDTTKPVVQITSHPKDLTKDTSAIFTFTATDALSGVASTECSLDNNTYAPCMATVSYTNLLEGAHQFSVRAKDNAGNDSLVATFKWTIDLTKPVLKITSGPLVLTKEKNAVFKMEVTDNITTAATIIQCRLDGNLVYDVCSNMQTYTAVDEGAHTFYARAIDFVGNMSNEVSYSWSVDSMGPAIIFSKIPMLKIGTYDTTTVAFAVTDQIAGVDSVNCDLNGSARTCGVSYSETFSKLPVGDYKYTVNATDKLGNASTNSVSWSVIESTISVTQDIAINSNKKVDILVVVDNSGSMSFEQSSMAARFTSFLNNLSGLDWQLAVVTTDLSADANLKDGRFVEFKGLPGQYVITSTMDPVAAATAFSGTIQRPEVGSGSEQGIGATYRAIQRSQDPTKTVNAPNVAFFRAGAAFSTLVVTDANETPGSSGTQTRNKPQELFNLVQTIFPSKPFLFNSIIVKSGDSTCLGKNGNEGYGVAYESISAMTGGVVGSVCETNYTNQLTSMGKAVVDLVNSVTLQCAPLDTTGDGVPDIMITLANGAAPPAYTLTGMKLTFASFLPPGQNTIQYTCLK